MTGEESKHDQESEAIQEETDTEQHDQSGEAVPVDTQIESEPEEQPGRVIKEEDLHEEVEFPKEEVEVLTKLYEKTITEFAEGEIVQGKILSISNKEVAVDIGFKSEGVISIAEFKSAGELNVGDDIEIFLDKIEDKDGQLILSKEKADFTRIWEKVVRQYENNETIEGKCMRRIKGGMVVDLTGIDAFLPGSQIDVKPVRDFDALLGITMQFKIVKVNHLRKNIVVSRRVIIEEGLSEQREKMLSELEKGQVRWGVVKNITDFGVFIDLGGMDGLLHITDLSWGRVSHPSDIVGLDEKIKVVVLDFDKEKKRVSLGLKQLQPHPWDTIEEKYPIDAKVRGKVVSLTDYGAFIELEKGVEGLIHISEMSWTQHIKHPSKILSIGEEVEAVVLNFDIEDKKISLGLKQIDPDPWSSVVKKFPIGSKHKGNVRNVTNFGVFVEIEEGIDGLVHISDLSWTKKVRHPNEIVKKGDEIEVVILNVSEDDRRISLGHKQLEENPWDTFASDFKEGEVTTGKIVRLFDKGLIVELNGGVEGFVPASHLEKAHDGIKKIKKPFSSGEEITLKVIQFDKDNKKIVLSQIEYIKDLEKQEVKEYLETQESLKEKEGKEGDVDAEKKKAEIDEKAEVGGGPEETGAEAETAPESPEPETKVEEEQPETTAEAAPVTAGDTDSEMTQIEPEVSEKAKKKKTKAKAKKPVKKPAPGAKAKAKKTTKKPSKKKDKDPDKGEDSAGS